MNTIIVMGRITAEPEIKTFNDGTEYCNISVAVDRGYKDKDGNRPVDFFNCKTIRGTAALVVKYFHKGDGIVLEGSMESRKYQTKEGSNVTAWELNVSKVHFPVGKKSDVNNVAESELPDVAQTTLTEMPDSGDLPF